MTDYKAMAQEMLNENKFMMNECAEVGKTMFQLHTHVMTDRALTKKHKELIALGIAISSRCEGCMVAHIKAALGFGATMEEIAETVEVAILMGGGPAVSYGGKAIEMAKQFSE